MTRPTWLAGAAIAFALVACGGSTSSLQADTSSGGGGSVGGGSGASDGSSTTTGTAGATSSGANGGATSSGATGSGATGSGATGSATNGGADGSATTGLGGTSDGGSIGSTDGGAIGDAASGRICGNGAVVGEPCPTGEFCKLETGTCELGDVPGQCVMQPQGWPKLSMPVCGCDGKTHLNEMEAWARGVSVSAVGECPGVGDGGTSDAVTRDAVTSDAVAADAVTVDATLRDSAAPDGATCSEPAQCEGYANSADARLSADVSCLSPNVVKAGVAFTLSIYGQHLVPGATSFAIVTIGASGVPLNGVPVSACHLTVAVPSNAVTSPGQAAVTVSPGGFLGVSNSVPLTIE